MTTRLLTTRGPARARNIRIAARLLRQGSLVAFPTETVYGLGANAFDVRAVRSIFRVKGRPSDNPLIVHVWSLDQIRSLVDVVPLMFWVLAGHFLPGPLTMVMRKARTVPSIVTAGLPSVAIRMPDHPVARALLKQARVPVVAPSANLSGRPSPTRAKHVQEDLGGRVAAILDAGACRIGVESTVLDITHRVPVILRPGGITREEIESVLGLRVKVARGHRTRVASPGMKYTHYAPAAEVIVFEGGIRSVIGAMKRMARDLEQKGMSVAIMCEEKHVRPFGQYEIRSLGTEEARSAAKHLYENFRSLDRSGADVILCQGFSEDRMGMALMNRLRKAATRRVRV